MTRTGTKQGEHHILLLFQHSASRSGAHRILSFLSFLSFLSSSSIPFPLLSSSLPLSLSLLLLPAPSSQNQIIMAATDVNTLSAPDNASPTTLEVGMAFLHEFYTFLNKEPSRLHLFYNKNSTMSHGFQGDDIETCHGQQACLRTLTCDSIMDEPSWQLQRTRPIES